LLEAGNAVGGMTPREHERNKNNVLCIFFYF